MPDLRASGASRPRSPGARVTNEHPERSPQPISGAPYANSRAIFHDHEGFCTPSGTKILRDHGKRPICAETDGTSSSGVVTEVVSSLKSAASHGPPEGAAPKTCSATATPPTATPPTATTPPAVT